MYELYRLEVSIRDIVAKLNKLNVASANNEVFLEMANKIALMQRVLSAVTTLTVLGCACASALYLVLGFPYSWIMTVILINNFFIGTPNMLYFLLKHNHRHRKPTASSLTSPAAAENTS